MTRRTSLRTSLTTWSRAQVDGILRITDAQAILGMWECVQGSDDMQYMV